MHENYEMVSSGSQVDAAQFLTGVPSVEYVTREGSIEEIWMRVTNAIKNEYMLIVKKNVVGR